MNPWQASKWLLFSLWCCPLLALETRAAEAVAPVHVYVHALPPILTTNGAQATGYLIDTLDALSKTVEQPYRTEVVPFQRGVLLAEKGKNTAFATIARTSALEGQFKWVGPLLVMRVFIYKKAGAAIVLKDVSALKAYRVAAVQGAAIHEELVRLKHPNVVLVPNLADGLRMLHSGAVDLLPSGEDFVAAALAERGLAADAVENTGVKLQEWPLYIAFSRAVPDAQIQQWQAALTKLQRTGELETIGRKYLGADRLLR